MLALLLLVSGPASAHATLEQSAPSAHSVLASPPARVLLTFDEAITALPGALDVYAPDGARLSTGAEYHPHSDGNRLAVALRHPSQQGTYLVSWHVISADSHPVSGTFTFSVGHRSVTHAAASSSAGPNGVVGILLGLTRWLGYLGAALLVGGRCFLFLCWPEGRTAARPRGLLLTAAMVSALSALAGFLLQGPYEADQTLWSIARPALLHDVLTATDGRALLARAALAALLGATALTPPRRPPTPARQITVALLGLALLLTFPATGHPWSDPQRALAITSDAVHTGAMALWLGGLVMLLIAGRAAVPDVARFSRLASSCVAALAVTGTYQGWRQVGSIDALFETTYGRELLAKLGLVACVLTAAALSRSRLHRTVTPSGPIHLALRRTVLAETTGILAVLAVTSALVATQPARTAYHPSVGTYLQLGPATVVVTGQPTGMHQMDLQLSVLNHIGRRTDPPEIDAVATLPAQRIGPIPIRLTRTGIGRRAGLLTVPVKGDWQLTITVRTTAINEYTGAIDVPIH